jgi:hypothetical protein
LKKMPVRAMQEKTAGNNSRQLFLWPAGRRSAAHAAHVFAGVSAPLLGFLRSRQSRCELPPVPKFACYTPAPQRLASVR